MPLSVVLCRRRDRMWQSPHSTTDTEGQLSHCHTVPIYYLSPLHRNAPPARRHHQSRRRSPIDVRPLTVVPEDTCTHGRSPLPSPPARNSTPFLPPATRSLSPFALSPGLLVCSSRPRLGCACACAAVSLPSADTHSGPPKSWNSIRMSPSFR